MIAARALLILLNLMVVQSCSSSSVPSSTAVPSVVEPAASRNSPPPTHTRVPSPVVELPTVTTAVVASQPAVATSLATALPLPTAAKPLTRLFSYPIGLSGKPLGDGFFVRHGAVVENTWYNPGYWHTGEDWYAVTGDTAGAHVYAIADGSVVYVGSNYPGRVVIVRHAGDLYSMYGHLDPNVQVQVDAPVLRGALLGTVLRRGDSTPNHLHFEIRTFLISEAVNGNAPRYNFRCGVNCPPGPGYWPIQSPELPSDFGWRLPTHVIAQRMYPADAPGALGEVLVATHLISTQVALWSGPPNGGVRRIVDTVDLQPGARFPLLDVYAGSEDTRDTSALAYQLWYAIALPDGGTGWVQAALPSRMETGSDGRPSSIYFHFFPLVEPPG